MSPFIISVIRIMYPEMPPEQVKQMAQQLAQQFPGESEQNLVLGILDEYMTGDEDEDE